MRTPRNKGFEAKQKRLELDPKRRHWVRLAPGLSLGYYRPERRSAPGTWYLRRRSGDTNRVQKLGAADDYQDANGKSVLSYREAVEFAFRAPEDDAGASPARPGGATVRDAAKAYLDDYTARSGKATAEVERVLDRDILPKLGDCYLSELTRAKLRDWRAGLVRQKPHGRDGKPMQTDDDDPDATRRRRATAERKFTALKAVLNFARAEGLIDNDSAWSSIRPFRGIDAPPKEFLTLNECRLLIQHADPEFRPLLAATFLTGAAWSELTRLRVRDYFPDTKHLRVFNSKRQPRTVPLTPDGVALFDDLTADRDGDDPMFVREDGATWQRGMQHRRMTDTVAAAELNRKVTLTDVRSAYGSLMLNAGARLETVSRAMGHSSIYVTAKHYARLLQQTIDDDVRDHLPSIGLQSEVRRLA